MALYLFAGLAVILTFSRSGIAIWLLVGILSTFSGQTSKIEEDARTEILLAAVKSAAQKPIFGHGYSFLDSVESVRAHNMVVELHHVYGLAGVIMWAWMLWILFRASVNVPLIARLPPLMFFLFSFFSHNLFEHVFWLVFFSLAVYVDGMSARNVVSRDDFLPSASRSRSSKRRIGLERKRKRRNSDGGSVRYRF